jgi:dTDP-4-dehydrorhamnose reductase
MTTAPCSPPSDLTGQRCSDGGVRELLVTGVSGFLGRAVAEAAVAAGWSVTGTYLAHPPAHDAAITAVRLDVRDADAVGALLAARRPAAVVHTAYVQHGEDTLEVNAGGAAHVAAAARAAGARLVHVSSDAIFRGDLGRPLREDDPPDPVTAYGATKAAAEAAVAAAHPGALLVRTSLLYGGPGHAPGPHEQVALAAARGQPAMTFYDDEIRCPVQVDDLAAALVELAATAHHGPLHVAGPDAVDRATFARMIAAAAGLDAGAIAAGPRPPDRSGDCALDRRAAEGLLRTRVRGVRAVFGAAVA